MKKVKLVFCIIYSISFLNCAKAQTDSLKTKAKLDFVYLGLGGGAGFRGGALIGLNTTFIYTNNWGFGITINSNIFEAADLPDDYQPGTDIFFESESNPKDVLTTYSFLVAIEFPDKTNVIRGGIEIGSSIVSYRKVIFTPSSPSSWYDSNSETSEKS